MDKSLNLQIHINKLVSSCYSILRHISSIRKFITEEQCHQLIISFLVSKLDYCNALYLGMSKELMYKLQKVQNAAIRIIVNKRKHQSVSEDMVKLHCLNIEKRIVFKVLLLVFKCLDNSAPNLLIHSISTKSNDSQSIFYRKLHENHFYTPLSSIGHKSFYFYAPRLWNALPRNLTHIIDLNSFKTALKTYLFTEFNVFKSYVNRIVKIL